MFAVSGAPTRQAVNSHFSSVDLYALASLGERRKSEAAPQMGPRKCQQGDHISVITLR